MNKIKVKIDRLSEKMTGVSQLTTQRFLRLCTISLRQTRWFQGSRVRRMRSVVQLTVVLQGQCNCQHQGNVHNSQTLDRRTGNTITSKILIPLTQPTWNFPNHIKSHILKSHFFFIITRFIAGDVQVKSNQWSHNNIMEVTTNMNVNHLTRTCRRFRGSFCWIILFGFPKLNR